MIISKWMRNATRKITYTISKFWIIYIKKKFMQKLFHKKNGYAKSNRISGKSNRIGIK